MTREIEALIEKHSLTHIKEKLLAHVFQCVKVIPTPITNLPIGSSKMGGVPDVSVTFEYPTYEGEPLSFIAQFNLVDLHKTGMKNDLPASGMLYFFYFDNENYEGFHEVYGNEYKRGSWRVMYDDAEQLQQIEGIDAKYPQCCLTFQVVEKLPELFIEDEDDSDRFLQLLEELMPDQYDNHQIFGEPFSVQNEVFEEMQEHVGAHHSDITLLFQVDSDEKNCHMAWGDMGMLYFCMANEDIKLRRFDKACCLLQSC
ncbi:hypothetical protein BAMA_19550 [Bacillus manliponensis]|uniref:Cytoplasmic protein n=1 Tax=Bacillus manliponensis TaxID=574376 RepID=A0A073K0L2_9BACI|nr:YwqG family protein [Bacillus manliponensis]KEK19962.1 hypothetical protein BAMA_19550 [Bacillus manliponensis]